MPPYEDGANCTDDDYVEFGSGSLPELRTGRWPAQSESELQAIMDKTIAYASHPLYGPWENTATYAADDEWKGPDCGEWGHVEHSEDLATDTLSLPEYFTVKKSTRCSIRFAAVPRVSEAGCKSRDLLRSINHGTLIVNFYRSR